MTESIPQPRPDGSLSRRREAENFPVALRLLPGRHRADLIALYDVARTIDDLGDEGPVDRRPARLAAFAADLAKIWAGAEPSEPVSRALAPVVRRLRLDQALFDDLIKANLQDQHVTRYDTHADLLGYCELSANPVGRLVLAVFGVRAAGVEELSDQVCTALQLVEHWQDVGEDYRNGRIYLPKADREQFDVPEADLGRGSASPALRRLIAFETERAAALLDAGAPLVARTRGWARLAIAGYVAGGRATVDALRRSGGDVLAADVHGRRTDLVRHLGALLVRPTRREHGMTTGPGTAEAYRHCAAITRSQARNFYYGISLLPKDKRAALCATYALARRIDDIGDEPGTLDAKLAALDGVRKELANIETTADPVLIAVGDAARRYPIPLSAFTELVDGVTLDVEMDLTGRRYASFDELVTYCRYVAGSVGRLCLGVFGGSAKPEAAEYADALGIALQQVNILRDIGEDLANGRIYVPGEDLERFGVHLELDEHGMLSDPEHRLPALVRELAARARTWFDRGLRLVPMLDRRSAACCLTMSGIYRGLLDRIEADPGLLLRERRVSLSTGHKVALAARALLAVKR